MKNTHNPRWCTHISQLTQYMPPPETYKSEIGSQSTICQVQAGAYVSLLTPGETKYSDCHPRKTTTYILHVVSITTHSIRTTGISQLEKKKQRKKKKIKERKEKRRKNETRRERQAKRSKRQEKQEKTRQESKERRREKKKKEIEEEKKEKCHTTSRP